MHSRSGTFGSGVAGSKELQQYLLPLPGDTFASLLRDGGALPGVTADGDQYLSDRLQLLCGSWKRSAGAMANDLPDYLITESGLKITPLSNSIARGSERIDAACP